MENTIKINTLDLIKNVFAISIAEKPSLYKDIDKIYNKNKLEYLKCYKSSSIYKSRLTESSPADTSRYTEKVIGIIEKAMIDKDFKDVVSLYQKRFKKIYTNTKNMKTVSILRDVVKYISIGYEANSEIYSTIFLYACLNKLENVEQEMINISPMLQDLQIHISYPETNFSKDKTKLFYNEIKEVREYLGIQKSSYTAEQLIEAIIQNDFKRYNKSKILIPHEMAKDTLIIEKKGEIGKYIGSMEGVFKFLNIDVSQLFKEITFTSFEIDQMILHYKYSKMFNSFNEKDRNGFLIYIIYISVLNKAYSNLKSKYLKLVNEDHLIEINTLEENLNKSIKETKTIKERYEEKETYYKNREDELLKRIKELEKENSKLKKEGKANEPLKQEVVKLRNLVFQSSDDVVDNTTSGEEIALDILNNKNTIIFGGNQSWINDMKKILPNANFIGIEGKNMNLNFINKDSLVFINTKIKHSFYYKIKAALEKTNIDYSYINTNSNTNLTLNSMNEYLKEMKLI